MRLPAICAATGLLLVALACGCGGDKKQSTTPGNGHSTGDSDNDSDRDSDTGNSDRDSDEDRPTGASPGKRLVAMVGEISTVLANGEDCDAFAGALAGWTNRNKAEFEKLVAEIQAAAERGEPYPDAAEMDEQIVEGYLAVVEAAAECGDNEGAMAAYDAFNNTVEKATY